MRAARAMRKAQSQRTLLEGFARAHTGNPKLKLEFTSDSPRTDGNTIYLVPPLALGDDYMHTPGKCDRYDSGGRPLCGACVHMEDILVQAIHEIGHITTGSFAEPRIEDVQWAIDNAVEEFITQQIENAKSDLVTAEANFANCACPGHEDLRDHAQRKCVTLTNPSRDWSYVRDAMEEQIKHASSYMGVAHHTSPWLPLLVNALEDSRVNAKIFETRAGTKRMFSHRAAEILEHGFDTLGGEHVEWRDRDLNAQVIMGAYLVASGYPDLVKHLDPKVAEVLADPDALEIAENASRLTNVSEVFNAARRLMEVFRKHGYLPKTQRELNQDQSESGPGEKSEDQQGDGNDDQQAGEGEGKGDAGDQPEDGTDTAGKGGSKSDNAEGDDEADGAGEGSSGSPQDGDDEAIKKAAKRAEKDLKALAGHGNEIEDDPEPDPDSIKPNSIVGMTDESAWDDGSEAKERAMNQHEFFGTPSTEIGKVNFRKLAKVQQPNNYYGYETIQSRYNRRVRLDETKLNGIVQGSLSRARMVFSENKAIKTTRGLKHGRVDSPTVGRKLITGDAKVFRHRTLPDTRDYAVVIGLDISGSTESGVITPMREAAYSMAELLHRLGISFAFYAHTGTPVYASYGEIDLDLLEVKTFEEHWTDEQRVRAAAIHSVCVNLDGHTLEVYRKLVEARPEKFGLIVYFTDGAMPCENYNEELEILQRECKYIKAHPNLDVLAVGCQTDAPKEHGLDTVQMDTSNDLPVLVKALEDKLTGRWAQR